MCVAYVPVPGDREVDAAELQLLHALGIVGELAGRKHLHLVAALRVLLDLLAEQLGRLLPQAARLVGVAELEHRLRSRRSDQRKRERRPPAPWPRM